MTPSLLGLPLLVGAFLTTLWLFGASPVHADALTGTLTGAVAGTVAGTPAGAGASESAGADTQEETGTRGPDRPGSLREVVPRQITEPVAQTLGTVGQGLGQHVGGADETTLLGEAGWPVDEVRKGARRVVADLDRTRRDTAQNLLSPAVDSATGVPAAPTSEVGADAGVPATADDRRERDGREEAPAATAGDALAGDAPPYFFGPAAGDAAQAAVPEEAQAPGGTDAPAAAAPSTQVATGSAAPAGGSAPAPGVAGYLTASPVTAPAPLAVLLASRSLHPVPSGPSGDPTFSPD
ncbi:flagellar associated protein [Nocardiopsis sp. NPDC058631]|uniref:flagellar associated protein n=1 Tax=Nocardiopsis sp. NPDC058631 TaxID=3346566 RepID=UPI003651A4A1